MANRVTLHEIGQQFAARAVQAALDVPDQFRRAVCADHERLPFELARDSLHPYGDEAPAAIVQELHHIHGELPADSLQRPGDSV